MTITSGTKLSYWESGHTPGKCSERKERSRSKISCGSWYADVRPIVLRDVASVFPSCSVSSSSDTSDEDSVVSSSIFVSSFSCLYLFKSTSICYEAAVPCCGARQL